MNLSDDVLEGKDCRNLVNHFPLHPSVWLERPITLERIKSACNFSTIELKHLKLNTYPHFAIPYL